MGRRYRGDPDGTIRINAVMAEEAKVAPGHKRETAKIKVNVVRL
jgi:hypothetical protein